MSSYGWYRPSFFAKISVVISLFAVVVQFQNCGPASMGTSGSADSNPNESASTATPTPIVNPQITTVQKVSMSVASVQPGGSVTLTYIFDAIPMSASHTIAVGFFSNSGTLIFSDDHTPPSSTLSWNGRIAYQRTVTVPAATAPGPLQLVLNFSDFPELGVGTAVITQGSTHVYLVGTLTVAAPPATPTPTPIAYVQGNANAVNGVVTNVQVTYAQMQKVGNLNIVAVGWNDDMGSVASVTDSQGNVYTRAVGPVVVPTLIQSIYYAKNIKAGANTVTVTFAGATNFPDVRISEFAGVSNLGVCAQATGNSATPQTGALSIVSPKELVYAAGMTAGGFMNAGTGFSLIGITGLGDIHEYAIANGPGTFVPNAPSSNNTWAFQGCSFRP